MAFIRKRRATAPDIAAVEPDPVKALADLTTETEIRPYTGPDVSPEQQASRRRRAQALAANLTRGLAQGLDRGGRQAARSAGSGARGLTDRLMTNAPRIPVRDLATLRAQHPNALDPETLADRLVAGACRASGAVGAGIGAAAMVPTPPAMAVEIATETLAVAAVEIKLIAELHEVYGMRAAGSTVQRSAAYVGAWANRRGIDGMSLVRPAGIVAMGAGSQVRRQVRRRLTRRSVRSLPVLVPFLVGAAFGATLNRRDTHRLAREVRADLRRRTPPDPMYWSRPPN